MSKKENAISRSNSLIISLSPGVRHTFKVLKVSEEWSSSNDVLMAKLRAGKVVGHNISATLPIFYLLNTKDNREYRYC